jgi:hypothetical protein
VSEVENRAKERRDWAEAVRLTHYSRADWFRTANNAIGVAAVVLSAVVSAGILTSIHNAPSFWWTVAAGIVGVGATSLTAIRAYLKLDELSKQHRLSAADFGRIQSRLDSLVLEHPPNDPGSRQRLDAILADIPNLEKEALGYPARVFHKKYNSLKKAKPHASLWARWRQAMKTTGQG